MTLIFALLGKEFFLKPRDKWFHVKRLLYVAVGGVIVLLVFAHQWHGRSNKAGLIMFEWLSLMVIAAAFLVGPYVSAAAIVSEKEAGTFNLLLLSDISVAQFLVSKLTSAVVATCLGVASTVPLFILCVSLGGISVQQVLLAFPILLSTIFSGACLGVLVSCFLAREVRMQGYVAIAAGAYFLALPAAIGLVGHYLDFDGRKVLVVVSSGMAMRTIARAEHLDLIGWNCLYNIAVGLPLLPLSWRLLPALHRRPGGAAAMLTHLRRKTGLTRSFVRRQERPAISGNPVTWKDLHIHYGGETGGWKRLALGSVLTTLAVIFGYAVVASLPNSRIQFEVLRLWWLIMLFLTLLCGINYLYGTLSRAAHCCSREKQRRTLELLLTTDVSGYSIVTGKSNAISLALLPWIVGFACSSIGFLFFSLLQPEFEMMYVLIAAAVILNLVCMVFAYEYIAIYISMRVDRYATAAALSGFVAWYVVGNLILGLIAAVLFPFTFYLSVIAAPVAGPVLIGHYFRRRLIREFPLISKLGLRY